MREKIFRSSNKCAWKKVGYCPSVSTSDYAIWGVASDYSFLTAETKPKVVSASASDTDTSGTGAWKIKIIYLTSAFVEKSEIVTLNGVTDVDMVAEDVFRINDIRLVEAGSDLKTAGNITVKDSTGAVTLGIILAGENEAKSLVYTVPKNKTLELFDIIASNSATASLKRSTLKVMSNFNSVDGTVMSNASGPILYTDLQIDLDQNIVHIQLGRDPERKEDSLRYPEGTDIVFKVLGIASGIISSTVMGVEY